MLETNIRVVSPGQSLYLDTRRIRVKSAIGTPETLQRISARLSSQIRCACIPVISAEPAEILALMQEPVGSTSIEFEDWTADLEDTGELRRLEFRNPGDRYLLAELLQRALLRSVHETTDWWRFDGFRTWYEPKPIQTSEDVAAFRRHRISAVVLEDVGIGIAVDVGTAFFTTLTVADYFADDGRLRGRFERLSMRQKGQKGTLLYDLRRSKHKCYFDSFSPGMACATTGPIRVKGKTYASLFAYLHENQPSAPVNPDDSVARVSFPGLDRPQPVPATRLRLRVMKESLPKALTDVDKLAPDERKLATSSFWDTIGERPFGLDGPGVSGTFWRPPTEKILFLPPPALLFGRARRIDPPIERTMPAYRKWFRERTKNLAGGGAFYVPPTAPRKIFFSAPSGVLEEAVERFAKDLCELISNWTGISFRPVRTPLYQGLEHGIALLLREADSGLTVFLFDDEDPASYFEIEYGLKRWRVKRVTCETLTEHFQAARSFLAKGASPGGNHAKPLWQWQSFVRLCALDVVQKLGCLPWRVEPTSPFEAELSIDVGADRRQFALSLFVNRPGGRQPDFFLETVTQWKADSKQESINAEVLREEILRIFKHLSGGDPLRSLLTLRDGGVCGREPDALDQAFATLRRQGNITADAEIAVVDVHKSALKGIRLWEVNEDGAVNNTLEGTGVQIDRLSVVLCSTGVASLHGATADPVVLEGREGTAMDKVAEQFFNSAQLNYSSPAVAQRLSAGLKRTDEELRARAAQEIRRLR